MTPRDAGACQDQGDGDGRAAQLAPGRNGAPGAQAAARRPGRAPGPWRQDGAHVLDRRDSTLCEVVQSLSRPSAAEAHATAAFIVNACNAHDEMLRWLQWSLSRIDPNNRGEYYERAQAFVADLKGQA